VSFLLEFYKSITPSIVEIVRERKDALPKLLRSKKIVLKELKAGRIVVAMDFIVSGFVYFRNKEDGTITLYEIAKRKSFKGSSVCKRLVDALKLNRKVIRLKCSIRNDKAKTFWDRMGFKSLALESIWNKGKGRYSTYYIMEWKPDV
jgi:hypothetical protein